MNRIVSLQGVQFPPGIGLLVLVSLRGAAAAVGSVFLSCFVQRGLRVPRVLLLLCARELLAR